MSALAQESHFSPCEDELEHPFVMVPRDLIRNPKISPECKWFISYLLSHSGKWKISIPYVIKNQNISKNRIYPIIQESIEAGYVDRIEYLEKGMKRYRYVVSRTPKFKKFLLCPQNQDTEKQDPENEDSKEEQSIPNGIERENKEKRRGRPLEPLSADADSYSSPKPRKVVKEEKKEVCDRVWISKSQHENLMKRANGDVNLVKQWYDRLSTWKVGKEIYNGKNDFQSITNWVIDAVKDTPMSSAQAKEIKVDRSKELAEKIRTKFPNHPDIDISSTYIGFKYGPMKYDTVNYSDNGFEEQILNHLRKMNLSTDGL